jgi:hypothetical protein
MPNPTRDNRTSEGESGFEGARTYDQRAGEAARPGKREGEGQEAVGPGVEGEGSYQAAREYDRGRGEFVRSGRMEQAARAAEAALAQDPEGHRQAEQQGKARARPDSGVEAESALSGSEVVAVHVKHERHGWVVEPGTSEDPAAVFNCMDDALRRAHEIAAQQHLPLLVHGPDGELIDRYDAL